MDLLNRPDIAFLERPGIAPYRAAILDALNQNQNELKADSHAHANGMPTREDIVCLRERHGDTKLSRRYIREDGSVIWHDKGFSESHEAYDAVVSLIQTPEDLGEVVAGFLRRSSEQGCIYIRILSSGLNNFRKGNHVEVFQANMLALIAAIEAVKQETGIEASISVSLKRHLGIEKGEQLLDAIAAFQDSHPRESLYITSIDLAGNEKPFDVKKLFSAYERAIMRRDQEDRKGKRGLGLTNSSGHAGEPLGCKDNIWDALKLSGVTELSHILCADGDPDLLRRLAEPASPDLYRTHAYAIDQLLVSNFMFHIENDHPVRRFFEAGLCICPGTDDPGIQGTHIGHEYALLQALGFTGAERFGFTLNTIRHAPMPNETKAGLLVRAWEQFERTDLSLRPQNFCLPGHRVKAYGM